MLVQLDYNLAQVQAQAQAQAQAPAPLPHHSAKSVNGQISDLKLCPNEETAEWLPPNKQSSTSNALASNGQTVC